MPTRAPWRRTLSDALGLLVAIAHHGEAGRIAHPLQESQNSSTMSAQIEARLTRLPFRLVRDGPERAHGNLVGERDRACALPIA